MPNAGSGILGLLTDTHRCVAAQTAVCAVCKVNRIPLVRILDKLRVDTDCRRGGRACRNCEFVICGCNRGTVGVRIVNLLLRAAVDRHIPTLELIVVNRICADCEIAVRIETHQLLPGVGTDANGARCRVARDITVCRGSIADTCPGGRIVQVLDIGNRDECTLAIRSCLQGKVQVLIRTLNHAARCESAVVGARVHVRRVVVAGEERNRNRLCAGCADCSRLIDVRKIRSALLTIQLVAVVIEELYLYANLIRRIASVGVLNLDVLVRHFAGQHAVRIELELAVCSKLVRTVNASVLVIRITAHNLHAVVDIARNGRRRHADRLLRILVLRGRCFNRGTGLIHILRAEREKLARIHNIEITNGQVIVRHHAAYDIATDHIDLRSAGAGTGILTEFALFVVLYNNRSYLIAGNRRWGERNCGDRIAHGLLRRGNPGRTVRVEGNVVAGIEAAAIGRRKLGVAAVQHAVVHYRVVEVLRHTARNPFRCVRLAIARHCNRKRRLNILQRIGSIVPAAKGVARIGHAPKIRERRSCIGIACVCGSTV